MKQKSMDWDWAISCLVVPVWIIFCAIMMICIVGCTPQTNIQTNKLYQTNYDYMCLDEPKTFSEIITCMQLQNNAERIQNNITNEILDS